MIIRDIKIKIPRNWKLQENSDTLSIYNNNGFGAITMSFYRIIKKKCEPIDHLCKVAMDFIQQNQMILEKGLQIDTSNTERIIVLANVKDYDGWFIRLYVIGNNSRFIIATYNTQYKTKEMEMVDKIIGSIRFI